MLLTSRLRAALFLDPPFRRFRPTPSFRHLSITVRIARPHRRNAITVPPSSPLPIECFFASFVDTRLSLLTLRYRLLCVHVLTTGSPT